MKRKKIIITAMVITMIVCIVAGVAIEKTKKNHKESSRESGSVKSVVLKSKDGTAVVPIITPESDEKKESADGKKLGKFKLTAYSYADDGGEINYHTSTGATPAPYYTVAVDPEIIPYGTKLYLEELDLMVEAQDCGGSVQGEHIDLHVGYDPSDSIALEEVTVWEVAE